jgi:hypothetical protein
MDMSDTPETDAALYPMTGVDIVWPDFARKLERERDEARVERDILRSNKMSDPLLETTFKHLICERDEAKEEADHWKIEYEIVVARLCGKKHPRDNSIVAGDEIIPKLIRALEWIAERYDDSKPMHQVAMDAYEMSCAARAILQKE